MVCCIFLVLKIRRFVSSEDFFGLDEGNEIKIVVNIPVVLDFL